MPKYPKKKYVKCRDYRKELYINHKNGDTQVSQRPIYRMSPLWTAVYTASATNELASQHNAEIKKKYNKKKEKKRVTRGLKK